MKKALLLLTTIWMAAGVASYGQGTVNFNTRVVPEVEARVFNVDGTSPLAGTQFTAQLWGGPSPDNLQPIPTVTTFRTGAGAGFVTPAGEVAVPGVAGGGTAHLQLRAWDNTTGATWETAGLKGASPTFTVSGLGNPGAVPPTPPPNLVGLQSFALVPEPSTIALAVLGAVALFLRRRKQ
jgi:hypothetical protein